MTIPRASGYVLRGVGVSPGYAIGRAHLLERETIKIRKYHVSPDQLQVEVARFLHALDSSEAQIQDIKSKLTGAGEEHYLILDAHQMILRDEMLVDGTKRFILEQSLNAEWALKRTVQKIKQLFDNIDDAYFRERRADVDFVADRILRNLLGDTNPSLSQVAEGAIVVAHDLSPSDTAFLTRTAIQGFVTDVGGKTSHTAIMARSLELPAVVGLEKITERVGTGDLLIVDGATGQVLVNPSSAEVQRYQRLQMSYHAARAQLDAVRREPAVTRDGASVRIRGNIEQPGETRALIGCGAEGIGLFRTEYLFMNREDLPGEDEQYRQYRVVLEACGELGATIRTLDLGGDKFIESLRQSRVLNPAMGLRAIRLCLKETEIFRTQLRALLRASVHGSLRVMIPLISGLEEVRAVKALLVQYRAELAAEGQRVADRIPLGVMIELPSAAVIADLLAKEVDFFSIGTNDLIQYTLAIDRADEHVAHMYQPLHPALLRMLAFIVRSAHAQGIDVAMCGEVAGDPFYLPVLLGLGLRELSMNSAAIPLARSIVRAVAKSECQAIYDAVRLMDTAKEIEGVVASRLETVLADRVSPEIFDPKSRLS